MSTWSVNISNPMIVGIAAVLSSTCTAVNFEYAKEKNLGFVPNCRILMDPWRSWWSHCMSGGWKSRYSLRTGCGGKGDWGRACFVLTRLFGLSKGGVTSLLKSHASWCPTVIFITQDLSWWRSKVGWRFSTCQYYIYTNWSARYTFSEFIHWKLTSWLVPIGIQI